MFRRDGLFFKQEGAGRSGKVASKKKVYMKPNSDDVVGLMNPNDKSELNKPYLAENEELKEEVLEGKKGKKRMIRKKKFADDDNLGVF